MRLDGPHGQDGDWNRVSGVTPCPICGSEADCRTHADEAFACCVQQPSEWRLTNGGWLHRIASVLQPGALDVLDDAVEGDALGLDAMEKASLGAASAGAMRRTNERRSAEASVGVIP